jgi:hypothetical protein
MTRCVAPASYWPTGLERPEPPPRPRHSSAIDWDDILSGGGILLLVAAILFLLVLAFVHPLVAIALAIILGVLFR